MATIKLFRLSVVGILFSSVFANAQGTFTFQNLDFESANVSGYSPGSMISVSAALPGWSAYIGGSQIQQMWYDVTSVGTTEIAVVDQFGMAHFPPLQGNYSAV